MHLFIKNRYITVSMKFDASISILKDEEVYPPSEDSILLIESFDVGHKEKILEIGCGSGIVSIHCAKNGADVTCGDLNPKAVSLTRRNAELNDASIMIVETDVFSNIEGVFDTIVFNLPYLPVQEDGELARSWSGGKDGLGPLPELLNGADSHLTDTGRVIIVTSSLMDELALSKLLSGYDVRVLSELPLFFERLKVLEIKLIR